MTPGGMTPTVPSPPSPTTPQKEGKEDFPIKGLSLSPLLPGEDRNHGVGGGPPPLGPPPPGPNAGYDRNLIFRFLLFIYIKYFWFLF